MDYGKLVVRWSDGNIEEYPVVKTTTSIGRAPGNDVVLPTSAVSRYHAHLKVEGKRVILVDLGTVNGTFVNNELMPPNSELQLVGGEEILLGDAMLIYHPPAGERGPTVVAPLEPGVQVIEEPSGFRVSLDEPRQSVAPGARLQLSLIIENQTGKPGLYTLELVGMDPEWAKANRREIHLEPREQTEVTITVRPPRSSDTVPGQYPLTVRVALKDDPGHTLELTRQIAVVGYGGLGMVVRPGRGPGMYQLAVQNQGNVPLGIQLGGWHPKRALRYRFEPARLELGSGETQQVSLIVHPVRPKLVGAPEDTSFAVVARSLDAANYQAPVPAVYTIAPALPGWAIWVAIPAALAVFALVGFLVLGLLGGGRGGPLAGGPPTATPPMPATGPAPGVTVTPDVSALPEITLFRPQIRTEDGQPQETLVAWVNQDGVELTWEAGSATTAILSDDCGLIVQQEGPFEDPHPLDLRDAEPGMCTFTLRVSNEAGEVTRSASLGIVHPVCTIAPLAGAVPQSAPGEDSGAMPRLDPRTEVQPYRQHRQDDVYWLLVRSQDESPLGWVQQDDLDCQGFDLETVRFVEDEEPTVLPTPTAEPTATPQRSFFP
jgi:hypothetical protein